MKLIENMKVIPIASEFDLTTSATNPLDSFKMTEGHHATFICVFGALGVASTQCRVYSGATDGALTSALTFHYAFSGAAALAASADVFGADATSADLTITHGTYDNYTLVIEVDASDMDVANGEEWLTLSFPDDATGATGNVTVVAVVEPRYKRNRMPTWLV